MARADAGVIATIGEEPRAEALVLVPVGGGRARPLARHAAALAWEPRGRLLAYAVTRVVRSGSQAGPAVEQSLVKVVDVNTGRHRLLHRTRPGLVIGGLAWSPDGRFIAEATLDTGIVAFDVRSRRRRQLTSRAGDRSPAWSPDGARLVFQRDQSLMVLDVRRGLADSIVSRGTEPAWAPNGRDILYSAEQADGREDCFEGGCQTRRDVFAVPADGSRRRRVGGTSVDDGLPSWGPRGQVAFAAFGSRGKTLVIESRGNRRTLSQPGTAIRDLAWQPGRAK